MNQTLPLLHYPFPQPVYFLLTHTFEMIVLYIKYSWISKRKNPWAVALHCQHQGDFCASTTTGHAISDEYRMFYSFFDYVIKRNSLKGGGAVIRIIMCRPLNVSSRRRRSGIASLNTCLEYSIHRHKPILAVLDGRPS